MKCLFVLLLAAATVQAQVAALVPDAKGMAAPDWVKPGVRLTWYVASASRQGKFTELGPDGRYKRPDGQRVHLRDGGSASGHGYTELWIVAAEPGKVVCELRSYSLATATPSGPGVLHTVVGSVSTTPGMVDEYWIHPAALRNLLARHERTPTGFLVAQTKHNDRDALMIAAPRSAANTLSYVYDLTSGVLLSLSTSTQGKRGVGGTTEDGTTYAGTTWSASASKFLEYKEVALPWLGQAVPTWLVRDRVWEFDGSFRMAAAGSTPPVPLSLRVRALAIGKTWALLERTAVNGPRSMLDRGGTAANGMPVSPSKSLVVSGAGSPTGFWIPPATIGRLTAGQKICASSVTEFTATVVHAGMLGGNDICVIRWENRLQLQDYVFDRRSGGALRVITRDKTLGTETVMVFAGAR